MKSISGTQGYAEAADTLLKAYEEISFEDVHAPILHLLPSRPSHVLDIGSGTGRDSAYFAKRGWWVTAVEPVDALRDGARRLHTSSRIDWIDDGLPELSATRSLGRTYDLVMLTGIWQHLHTAERSTSMGNVASLVAAKGRVMMSIRRGPAPVHRRQFDVPAEETISLAESHGLKTVLALERESLQQANRNAGVTWLRLVFERS